MPIPKPRDEEERDAFISRCMGNDSMKDEYTDGDQRLAVCFTAWRDVHGGEPPQKSKVVRKYYALPRSAGPDEEGILITTMDVDFEADRVFPEGADLGMYLRNPVVLWLHDAYGHTASAGIPVGTTKSLEIIPGKGIRATGIDWLEGDEFADRVRNAWAQGKIRGASIGFLPIEARPNTHGGYDHLRWKLLEWSLVPIPANPTAIRRVGGGAVVLATKRAGVEVESTLELDPRLLKSDVELDKLIQKVPATTGALPFVSITPAYDAPSGGTTVRFWLEGEEKAGRVLSAHNMERCEKADHCLDELIGKANEVKALVGEMVAEELDRRPPAKPEDQEPEYLGTIAAAGGPIAVKTQADPLRWNRQVSKQFDVARQQFEPATAEITVVSRYFDCDVRDLRHEELFVPSARMGSFLSALEEAIAAWRVEDVRNLLRDGTEAPLGHDVIQLNSTTRRDFLIDGMRFMRRADHVKLILKVSPEWYGLNFETYVKLEQSTVATELIDQIGRRAKELNFLTGEAFALSGEFLPRGVETWADLFLDEKNEAPLRRAVELLNKKGKTLANRGILLTGPPGTGKTLSGRVMMNTAESTFIWVSARDFYRSGAFGGLAYAFDMARECAPTILFIEDIDNWLDGYTIDLLKTEMDGIARSTGVVTILTTNYPEMLPPALLDRPGRFHDLLQLELPGEGIRTRMLTAWIPGLDDAVLASVVKATDGYSGAHIHELVKFAQVILEEEQLEQGPALEQALAKLQEQRDVITAVQTGGSRYRPSKTLMALVTRGQVRKHAWPKPSQTPTVAIGAEPSREVLQAVRDGLEKGLRRSRAVQ